MTKVLITRPKATATRLADLLQKYDYDPIIEPLLIIKPTKAIVPAFEQMNAIMITSQNVFAALEYHRDNITNLLRLPCFCVGPRTAETAKLFGFHQVTHTDSDGIELANHIHENLPSSQNQLLHISGEHTSTQAFKQLEERGYQVRTWAIYKAEAVDSLTPTLQQNLHDQKITAILFFSPRTAELFVSLIAQYTLQACCSTITAIGLSNAVANALRPLSWHQIVVAESPTEAAMIASLQHCYPTA